MAESSKHRVRNPTEYEEIQPLNREQKRMIAWLRKVRFKKRLFGGVSERDVWKKIEELNGLFNQALIAERARYDALLQGRWDYTGRYAGMYTTPSVKERDKT